MKKVAKKTIIFMILAAIVVTAMIGFAGCSNKLDGLYKEHVIHVYGDEQPSCAIKIEGNKIQSFGKVYDSKKGWSDDYPELDGETTFTRSGDKLILATALGTNKYFEFEVTKGGNLIGRCPNIVDGTTVEQIFLKPEKK